MNNMGLFLSFEEAEADVRNVAHSLGWDVTEVHWFDTYYSFTLRRVVLLPNTAKCLKRVFELIPGSINPSWKSILKKALIDQEIEARAPGQADPYSKTILNMDIAHMHPGIDIVDLGPVSVAVEKPTYRDFRYEVGKIAKDLGWQLEETRMDYGDDGPVYTVEFTKPRESGHVTRRTFNFNPKNMGKHVWQQDIINCLNRADNFSANLRRALLPSPFTKDHDDLPDAIVNYCKEDAKQMARFYEPDHWKNTIGPVKKSTLPKIKKVHSNDPVTAVIWEDGTKTLVRVQNGEQFDPEKGLAMAIAKKALGNTSAYYDIFKKHLKNAAKPEEKSVKNDAFGKCQACAHGKEPISAPTCEHCFFVSPHPNYTPIREGECNCWNCAHHNTISDNCKRCYPGQYDGFEPKEVTNEN